MSALDRNRLAWAGILLAGLCFGLAGMSLSAWFLVPFFANVFGARFILERIDCPNCRAPLTFEGNRLVDRIGIPSGWTRKTCAACGWDLARTPFKDVSHRPTAPGAGSAE